MEEKNVFCAYPRFHLQVKPNGLIKPCCRFDVAEAEKFSPMPGDLGLLHSKSWEQLRLQMNQNQSHPGCYKCQQEESLGQISMRVSPDQAQAEWNINPDIIALQYLEIGFGNLCNLACRSCGSQLSSKWFEDDQYLAETFDQQRDVASKKIIDANLDFSDSETLSQLKLVKFTGGEPFLHKNFWVFLGELVKANVHQTVQLRICTNASFIPKSQNLDLLKKFAKVDISVSIDGHGQHNDYLRHHSVWEDTEAVLNQWKFIANQHPEWSLTLCTTISTYSIESYLPLRRWWEVFSANQRYKVFHQPVFSPSYLSPAILPETVVNDLGDELPPVVKKYFSSKTSNNKNLANFYKYTRLLDEKRGENFSLVFPKLANQLKDYHD